MNAPMRNDEAADAQLRVDLAAYRKLVCESQAARERVCLDLEQAHNELAAAETQLVELTQRRDQLRVRTNEYNALAAQTEATYSASLTELDALLLRQQKVQAVALRELRSRCQELQTDGYQPATIDDLAWVNKRAALRVPLAVEVDLVSENNFFAGFSENISEGECS
jgi:hypothetical protein